MEIVSKQQHQHQNKRKFENDYSYKNQKKTKLISTSNINIIDKINNNIDFIKDSLVSKEQNVKDFKLIINPAKFEYLKNTKFFNIICVNNISKTKIVKNALFLYKFLDSLIDIPEIKIEESIYYRFCYHHINESFNLSCIDEKFIDIRMMKKSFDYKSNYYCIPNKFKNKEFYELAIVWNNTKKLLINMVEDELLKSKLKKQYNEKKKITICEYFLKNLEDVPDNYKNTYLCFVSLIQNHNSWSQISMDRVFMNNLMKNVFELNIDFNNINSINDFCEIISSINKESYKRLSYCVVTIIDKITDFDSVLSILNPEYINLFSKLCILIKKDSPVLDKDCYDFYMKIYKTNLSISLKYRVNFINVVEEKCDQACCVTYADIEGYYYKCKNKSEHVYSSCVYEKDLKPICFLCASDSIDFNTIYKSI